MIILQDAFDVTDKALQVSQGIADRGFTVVASGFFLVVCVIMFVWVFQSKKASEKREQDRYDLREKQDVEMRRKFQDELQQSNERIFEIITLMQQLLTEVSNKLVYTLEVLQGPTLYQTRIFTDSIFNESQISVLHQLDNIAEFNNLGNEQDVIAKISRFVCNQHEKRNDKLDACKFNGYKLSQFTNREWIDRIISHMKDELYRKDGYHRHRAINVFKGLFDEFKIEFYNKLKMEGKG